MKHPTDIVTGVARRRWRGDAGQEQILAKLAVTFEESRDLAEKAQAREEDGWDVARVAREAGIPDTVICQRGDISRTTLQRKLGHRPEGGE